MVNGNENKKRTVGLVGFVPGHDHFQRAGGEPRKRPQDAAYANEEQPEEDVAGSHHMS